MSYKQGISKRIILEPQQTKVVQKLKKLKRLRQKLDIQKDFKTQFTNFRFDHIRHVGHYKPPTVNPFDTYFSKLFDNQKQFGDSIFNNYVENLSLVHTLAVAPTQSGKTGSMLSLIHKAVSHKIHGVPLENIFIFTAHSSKEWLLQTRERFPTLFHSNILHRNNLKQIIQKLKNKTNVLLILDEVQIGMKFYQTLFKLFRALNYYNFDTIFKHNIKIVSFTATPNSIGQDLSLWNNSGIVVNMPVPDAYLSHQKLLESNRVLQFKDLTCFDENTNTVNSEAYDNISEILPFIRNMPSPKYHIIRTPRAKLHDVTIQNFNHVLLQSDFPFQLISETTIADFDSFIASPPNVHTFIFIKDKLRCAKTLHKLHLGILYERFVKRPIYDTIIQGLAGRLTGYHSNENSVVFTHLPFFAPIQFKHTPSAFLPF